MKKRYIIFILLVCGLLGCNETVLIEPGFSSRADWAPAISIDQNHYQRILLSFDQPPLEIRRNINRFIIEARKHFSSEFAYVGDLAYNGRSSRPTYLSEGVFEDGSDYQCRVTVEYANGDRLSSSPVKFTTPEVPGRTISAIFLPPPPGYSQFRPDAFTLLGNNFYFIRDNELYRIDSLGNNFTNLNRRLAFNGMIIYNTIIGYNDRLYFLGSLANNPQTLSIIYYDISAAGFARDSIVTINTAMPGNFVSLVSIDDQVAMLYRMDTSTNERQFHRVNYRTGAVLESYPPFYLPRETYGSNYKVAFDGQRYWMHQQKWFDNRFREIRLDGIFTDRHNRNPVFDPLWDFVVDGSYFWVYDIEAGTLKKILPEGL